MSLSSQDFFKGVDFTGLALFTAEDLNTLVDAASPVSDDGIIIGKGIVLVTTDTALDTPDTPTCEIVTKWKRYLWLRKPFDITGVHKLYSWNDITDIDPFLLNWVQLFPDTTEFNAAIAAIQADIITVTATANNAIATANAANTIASQATATATAANATANSISAIATAADTKAQTALDGVSALEDEITAATTAASAKKDVNAALIPGLIPLQLIRTNATNSAVEWFNVKDTYIKLSETKVLNTNCGGAVTGENVRDMNTEDYNTQASILSSPADSRFTLPIGTYNVRIEVPGFGTSNHHQAFLKTNGGVTVLAGTSASMGSASKVLSVSVITGIITIAVATKFKISDYWEGNEATTGLGEACNVNPDGGNEVYTIAEFRRIG